jgi:uncharacterized protein
VRVLLDANVLISYLLSRRPESAIGQVVRAALLGQFRLLIAGRLLEEIAETVRDDSYLAERITPEAVQALLAVLAENAELLPPISGSIPAVARDPKDDYLLAYAFTGPADYLVTGDRDLLVLGQVDQLQIVTVRQCLTILACIEDSRRSQP